MEPSIWQQNPLEWANLYALLAPRAPVKGRMALILLLAVVWAFGWLLWRAYSVIQTPNEVLVDKLGLDIPPPPLVTLEEISAREVQISWKSTDATASIQEHQVEVNRKIIGITKKTEIAVAIYNLRPGTVYDIRIFSISTGRFQTPSTALHVRTSLSRVGCQNDRGEDAPAIRALSQRLPVIPSNVSTPSASRESIGGPSARRGTGARKPSPASHESTYLDGTVRSTEEEADESLVELSQQYQKIQQEIEGIEAQIIEDDREHEVSIKEKELERDELKQKLKERDELSGELRKQVHKAEAANRAAQTEKAKKERLLDQKQSQRRKRKDDVIRWEEQMAIMADEIESLKTRKGIAERKKQSDISEIRQKIEEEDRQVKILEAENKEKALEIKALEEERQNLSVEEETDESREVDRLEYEQDRKWREMMNGLQAQYVRVAYDVQSSHEQHRLIRERLDHTRRAVAYSCTPIMHPDIDHYRRGPLATRQNRHTSSLGSNISSPRAAFNNIEPYSMNAHLNNVINTSPTTMGPSFFNTANGMTLMSSDPRNEVLEEPEPLSGGPMSPRADALLPADLLGDGSSDGFEDEDGEDVNEEPRRQASITNGELDIVKEGHVPPSPDAASSPRSFQSPNEELRSRIDWDQKSSNSPASGINEEETYGVSKGNVSAKKPSAMANLFGLSRQRGKTLADQPPLLGSLKQQSQSFPRNFDEFDPSGQPRRRLSYGSSWGPLGSNVLNRGQSVREPERMSATRRAFPGWFNRNSGATQSYDPFASETSARGEGSPSRPSSVYSFDILPRVSVEGQFHAWAPDKGMRNSPLAPDWSTMSRNHSRRPSIFGSTSNLSLGPGMDDDYVQPRREIARPLQAPIGTRPISSQRPSTPKLNPAAPSFTTRLLGKSREKAKEKAKAKEEAKKASEVESTSPPESRKSKDTYSIAATASTYESRESLERYVSQYSGGTTPMGENTPAKPTFMSKMARKASSNKFGSWKGQGGIFSRKESSTAGGTPTGAGTETEDEIHNSSHEQLGKSLESITSTPTDKEDKKASRNSLSGWNFMRKNKKTDKDKKDDLAASEVSESISSERASRASVDVTTGKEDEVDIPLH